MAVTVPFTFTAGQALSVPPKISFMNLLVVAVTSLKFKSAFIISSDFFSITPLSSVRLKNLGMDKIQLLWGLHFTSNSRKPSWQKFHFYNHLTCEFTAHYLCRNTEIYLKSITTKRFNFQLLNWLVQSCAILVGGGGGGGLVHMTWPDCKSTQFILRLFNGNAERGGKHKIWCGNMLAYLTRFCSKGYQKYRCTLN